MATTDEVYRLQNLTTGVDPECRFFQKFAEVGHYREPGASRQGTYCVTPSGMLLGSINSNDPKQIVSLMEKSLAKWAALKREERLRSDDPKEQLAHIKRPEQHYPKDGLVLLVTSRDLPRNGRDDQPAPSDWRALAWNHDFAWFTQAEARQFVPPEPKVGAKHGLPLAIVHRLACAHLIDNVRGQTSPFEIDQVKKARMTSEVIAVDDKLITVRLEGETRSEIGGPRKHGLDMRILGKATFDLKTASFQTFEIVALGSRWGATQYNGRRSDTNAAPIGIVMTLAEDTPCQRIAPAFFYHDVYRPVMLPQ